ncbi:Oidioi.mRNA.OKI2018_I69.PAR.g8509.t1.cds [Oikopleura dioica]|uniref:Oidioi.mRNA.OKI2018_I69.PAR.g8509.t1.cds n=1 Tax=Oikopleura dioica TaxID=34765 RepID=A0ABN7RJU8_OIKDI|nr:Oidioi.mRNA.OKI2018_I69.PAR.g8509.t1.cds [Oikopleura dioica]
MKGDIDSPYQCRFLNAETRESVLDDIKKQLHDERRKMFVKQQDLQRRKNELVTLVRTKYPDSKEYSEKADGSAIFSSVPIPGSSGAEVEKAEENEKELPDEKPDDRLQTSRNDGETRDSGDEAYDPENATFSGGYADCYDGDSDFSGGGHLHQDLADLDIDNDFEGDTTDDETDTDPEEDHEPGLLDDDEDYDHQDFGNLDGFTEEDMNYDKHDEYETGLYAWDRI